MTKSGFKFQWTMFRLLKNNIEFWESLIEKPNQSVERNRLCAGEIRANLNLLEKTEPSYDLEFLVTLRSFIEETYGHLRDYKDRGLI